MSGSETGVMTSREPFIVGLQKGPVQLQNMRLGFNADVSSVYQPVGASSPTYQSSVPGPISGAGGYNGTGGEEGSAGGGHITSSGINMNMSSESMKKKRGRPRKYGPDGSMALALTPTPSATVTQPSGDFSPPITTVPPPSGGSALPPSTFKKRGRPLGSTSSKKQRMESLGSMGFGFTPHVITVMAGEDVSSKIMSFSQRGTRTVCVLSANGAISNVTLRQVATSGGSVTYEGRFEILSLSGSFLLTENAGARGRTGGLSVSLSGPDGRVLGGSVAGLLTAASPVQVVVGSFAADGRKELKPTRQIEPLYAATNPPHCGPTGTSSPPSRGTLSESSGGAGSPLNLSTEACNNNNSQGMLSMPWK